MHSYVINPWMILPFGILLAAIAIMPLLAHSWWERHYPKVALLLGAITLAYYFLGLKEVHRPMESGHEYISFICLMGSLFVVAGGIHIRVKGEATPFTNVIFLAIGGILANLIGTTGASMLLIRPFLRANKYRLTNFHVVFFIFIVSNVGGSLTPIGDPPLYLGFLKGVPFFWTTQNLFPMWLTGMLWLLGIFYVMDRRNFYRAPEVVREKETTQETWAFDGLRNLLWLGVILVALFIRTPLFLREGIMCFAAWMSWRSTPSQIHESNHFSWEPLREVAILFAGIFATMIPALDWLEMNSGRLGLVSLSQYYWSCGGLSAVLDNAPTYLNFLSAMNGLFVNQNFVNELHALIQSHGALALSGSAADHAAELLRTMRAIQIFHPEALRAAQVPLEDVQMGYLLGNHPLHLAAISVASVFFGACTYIGNGPNFMVKKIADQSGAKTPGFFGYIFKFTLPILLPLLLLIWNSFFMG